MNFRNNEILISEEVKFYLGLEAKRIKGDSDGHLTIDQVADGLLRYKLTTENPEWVLLWDEHEKVKADSIKKYRAIEERALAPAVKQEAA